ncbi:PDZ domain-containing protein [Carboxydochorda subterranea]|uniref:PDZ domain-containing protein n=1 Tax=Carboxydichorda subterranea TaxID=3109565 RepID=A0ABZ1C235_9FIRM|nr:PDZ domain-containing protein [Limnochorda sp. L945t]WRP18905.1 PDZ domain-containing protein [Limnochorda sp. L945t]
MGDLLRLIGESLLGLIASPTALLLLSVVVWFVYVQAARSAAVEQYMFGVVRTSTRRQTLQALGMGLLGGALATALFVGLGITFDISFIDTWRILFLMALALALVQPRFMCFAYAGGLGSLASLVAALFGWRLGVDVPAVMALVGALHLVEALLVWLDGHISPTPLYIKQPDGQVVGGFALQKVWPLPFVAAVGFVVAREMVTGQTVPMPDWWPLFGPRTPVPAGHEMVFHLLPVVAGLGYGDFTVTRDPRVKARDSAGGLVLFSLLLLALALGARQVTALAWVAAIFSPLGHDLLIHWGRRREHGEPVFVSRDGVMVLDVLPNTPAAQMGLHPGDLIRAFNGQAVRNREELQAAMEPWSVDVELEVENRLGPSRGRRVVRYPGRVPPLGIVPAPEPDEPRYVTLQMSGPLQRWWRRLRRRLEGRPL